ncbi:hypothetical protein X975_11464, partial [Stegodyphus mimosarum]
MIQDPILIYNRTRFRKVCIYAFCIAYVWCMYAYVYVHTHIYFLVWS